MAQQLRAITDFTEDSDSVSIIQMAAHNHLKIHFQVTFHSVLDLIGTRQEHDVHTFRKISMHMK